MVTNGHRWICADCGQGALRVREEDPLRRPHYAYTGKGVWGPDGDPLKLGSVQYQKGRLAPNGEIGQNGNLAVYLTQQSDHPYLWLVQEKSRFPSRHRS